MNRCLRQSRRTGPAGPVQRVLAVALIGAVLAGLVFEAYVVLNFHLESRAGLPPTLGNFERVRSLLANDGPGQQFSFAVVGDTRGYGTFENIAEELRGEHLSFMVLLGDCVPAGTPGYHAFFRAEWAEYGNITFPIFYVVGNHDLDPKEYSLSEFEKDYGPTNFTFEYQGCLFVVLPMIGGPDSTENGIRFLESQLSDRRDRYRKVFVFMHIPAPVLPELAGGAMQSPEKLISVFDKYRVDYVISGDYHGYARIKLKDTTYLISGGGGAHLKKEKFGQFHHAMMITVGPDSVTERILAVPRYEEVEDRLESFDMVTVHPWLTKHWVLLAVLNVGMIGLGLGLTGWLIKASRSCRTGDSSRSKQQKQ